MLSQEHIDEWTRQAPWKETDLVAQDLVLSRALADLFSNPILTEKVALRGGTALHKLWTERARYSEDIDIVQKERERSGPIMNAIRDALSPWLGEASSKRSYELIRFIYRFKSSEDEPTSLRLKIELNPNEKSSILGFQRKPYAIESSWYSKSCEITTYDINETLATKLRAFLQRRKVRDLFDLDIGLQHPQTKPNLITSVFLEYAKFSVWPFSISRAAEGPVARDQFLGA